MTRSTRSFILLVTLPLGAAVLRAQSMPSISGAKNAATHAAAAASAHTEAMQNDQGTPPSQPQQQSTVSMPAKSAPSQGSSATPGSATTAKPAQAGSAKSAPSKPSSAPPAWLANAPAGPASKGAPAKNEASKAPVAATSTTSASPKAPAPKVATSVVVAAPAKGAKVTKGSPAAPAGETSVSERGGKNEISLIREVYAYNPESRRDPFVSLLMSGELRPMISDLKLVTVVYDPTGRSVAILRDLTTKEQYRVRVGQALGRMRVAAILPRNVTFTLEELGFSRQETLALNDSTKARSQ